MVKYICKLTVWDHSLNLKFTWESCESLTHINSSHFGNKINLNLNFKPEPDSKTSWPGSWFSMWRDFLWPYGDRVSRKWKYKESSFCFWRVAWANLWNQVLQMSKFGHGHAPKAGLESLRNLIKLDTPLDLFSAEYYIHSKFRINHRLVFEEAQTILYFWRLIIVEFRASAKKREDDATLFKVSNNQSWLWGSLKKRVIFNVCNFESVTYPKLLITSFTNKQRTWEASMERNNLLFFLLFTRIARLKKFDSGNSIIIFFVELVVS